MTIIPAIDLIDGKCVRLSRGDYSQKTIYHQHPLDIALQFQEAGLKRLHLVDLDGARAGTVKNWKVLEEIASRTELVIDFSGGINKQKDVEMAFDSGAAYVAVGTIAVKDEPTFSGWLSVYGEDRFIIAVDVKDNKVVVKGWRETTEWTVSGLIGKYKQKGVQQFFCTDVNRDGLLQGPATGLYQRILKEHPSIDLIASGGVSDLKDLEDLKEAGCDGAIIGKAIYENRVSLNDLKIFL